MCRVWRMLRDCSQATFFTQCTYLATRLSSITTATTGETTIGSGKHSDLLMMGIKCPKHVEVLLITNKSLFSASIWSLLYLLTKDRLQFLQSAYLLVSMHYYFRLKSTQDPLFQEPSVYSSIPNYTQLILSVI